MGESWILGVLERPATPLYFLVVIAIAVVSRVLPAVMERLNQRAELEAGITDKDWGRLRDEIGRLDGRLKSVEEECTDLRAKYHECEEERRVWMGRAVAAEAAHLGRGEAMNEAQKIISADRLKDHDKRGDK